MHSERGEPHYKPLPEGEFIRILELLPGKAEDPISGNLNLVSLEAAWKTYDAISYVWGDQASQRDIFIDNERLSITVSLWEALHNFRDERKKRILWADAICIQQLYPPEKAVQVQLMSKIYEGAASVRVWLGLDTLGVAQETVDFILENVSISRDLIMRYGSITAVRTLPDDDNPISKDRDKWLLYEQFLQLPWFNRVWVIQEVGVAREAIMHWGDAEIPFAAVINLNEFMLLGQHLFRFHPMSWILHDAFVGIFNYYENQDSWREQLFPGVCDHWKRVSARPTLSGLFIQGSRRGVTDNRDLIYAFLGHPVANQDGAPFVKVDYVKDVNEVYFDAMVRLLGLEPNPGLPLAVAAGMGKKKPRDLNENLPTWVIRWELGLQVNWMCAPGHWHYAGGIEERVPKVDVDMEKKTLTLVGAVFDKVTWVSEMILPKDVAIDMLVENHDRIPALEWLWKDFEKIQSRYPEGLHRRDVMTVTLIAGRWPNDQERKADDAENLEKHRAFVDGYLKYIAFARKRGTQTSQSNVAASEEMTELLSYARDYEVLFSLVASNRRMFVTEKGFLGIGPPLLVEGDLVTVFQGVKTPFCLRDAISTERSSYKLVGPAYVHGVMRGEVLDDNDPLDLGSVRQRDIVLV
ncbi:uncharacterized protein PV09_08183 [Verruconis gallopava]|uniref:Heterokaryon incompatibility domain-containing protein n=1 Tax=Verruconis gallopava TaxID=253628 RepID=A0A0D2A0U9_9PEZI|nr:uncharacterized protein PV09_08183 [Verruconis gallopava]KIW00293.1 hypothetical protein PV09_08183 [Verruconis gallopava]